MAFDNDRPIFIQLADQIADDIANGAYAEGTAVPSTNELSAFHRINPATAGRALNLLVDRQLLEKHRGRGMFVVAGARAQLLSERRSRFAEQFVAPMLREAQRLGLTRDEVRGTITQMSQVTQTVDTSHATRTNPTNPPGQTAQPTQAAQSAHPDQLDLDRRTR
ncbi:GntR family transcriptional regulator [Pseudoclavibacter sp. 13-3]|uniref:GntR family transcriptional regulator n=1 Tax=Pseudoclavibacter sp. 13-3 TaxID=2901228 RepID=UPI001E56ABB7|nr:GntR family transcriptional regulator [Pseudoclavibacter sp. 13-3]